MSELSLSAKDPLSGELRLPGDKSLSHRASLFAALAEGESVIDGFPLSGVTRAMLNALTALQVSWRLEGERLIVKGRGLPGICAPSAPINCVYSATTLRLLAGALAATGTPCVLDGMRGLRTRPMGRITEPLAMMGVPITAIDSCAPLTLAARPMETPLRAIDYMQPFPSAQVKSCLILAALGADGVSTLREPELSRDHTEHMLISMGADIRIAGGEAAVEVAPLARPLTPLDIMLPGDISSAAFLLVAAAIVPGSSILIRNTGVNPTRTGILDVLSEMGAKVTVENVRMVADEPVGDIRLTSSGLKAIRVSGSTVGRMIDEFPAFAIAACFAEGTTDVFDAAELRNKETDRIEVLCRELRLLGVELDEYDDGFAVKGGTLKGGTCDASCDHRLAMAFALAGLRSPEPVRVANYTILNESFPGFTAALTLLGVKTNG